MADYQLGRAVTDQYHTSITTTIGPAIQRIMSPLPSITEAPNLAGAMIASGHDDQQVLPPGEVTAIQSPLLAGFENSSALIHAMLASFSVILVSELGDKTFIITAIMAMKNSRSLVFMASALALFVMTVLSVGMGVAVTVIPEKYTHYASIVLFLCFGVKMLKEAYDLGADEGDGESEFEEVERSLEEDLKSGKDKIKPPAGGKDEEHHEMSGDNSKLKLQSDGTEQILPAEEEQKNYWKKIVETLYVAPIVIKVFTMIFVAEWGDRSQISTVILAAREDVVGVFVGSLSGHVLCTGLAVIGGRVVAEIISIRTLTFIGGIIFLFFATFEIICGPE